MAVDGMMNVEAASKATGGSPFGKALAVLVGLLAVASAVLATVETSDAKSSERAQLMTSRISIDLYGRQTVRQIVDDAQRAAVEKARVAAVEASNDAEMRAAARLMAIASSVGRVPGAASGLDPATRVAMATTDRALEGLQVRLVGQLAAAGRLGQRRTRAVFALTLAGLAGVLLGLAAVIGADRTGWVSLGLGTVSLLLAVGWGVAALA